MVSEACFESSTMLNENIVDSDTGWHTTVTLYNFSITECSLLQNFLLDYNELFSNTTTASVALAV